MRINRPYVPFSVRALVAERQAAAKGFIPNPNLPANLRLRSCLIFLFGTARVHLDHDPPLMNRTKVIRKDGQIGGYVPAANDPDHLVYRIAEDHRIKTFIHGDGAQRSDVAQRRYLNRIEENRNPEPTFKPRKPKQIRRISDAVPVIHRHGAKVE